MALSDNSKHEIYHGAVLDVDRHAGNETPTTPIPKPQVGGAFELNSAVARGEKCNRLVSLYCPSDAISTSLPGLKAFEHK